MFSTHNPISGSQQRRSAGAGIVISITSCFAIALLVAVSSTTIGSPIDRDGGFRPIEFTSRAQCALNSTSPARSILVVGDGQDAGRLAYNLRSKMHVALTETEALSAYRKAIAFTFKLVTEKLISGNLQLISGPTAPADIRGLLDSCEKQNGCRLLESKLETLWRNSASLRSPKPAARVGCHKVNQFSALQGHLGKSRPTQADLEEIGSLLAAKNGEEPSCTSDSKTTDRHFLLQIDLLAIDETSFEKSGFDFWRSVKTYAAWAWRNAPEVKKSMGRFGALFPSLALEDELILVPNGCRSMSLPKCELQRLSLDALRELAKPPGISSGFERNVPNGPQDDLIKRGARSVNTGFLGTQGSEAQSWVGNFTTRFNEARWASRNKLQGALRHAGFMEKLSSDLLLKDIEAELQTFNAPANFHLASQMAAVCLEARVLQDPSLALLRPDFDTVLASASDLLPEVQTGRQSLQRFAAAAVNLARKLQPVCASLDKSLFTTRNAAGFGWGYLADWTRERLGPIAGEEKIAPFDAVTKRRGWNRPDAYLTLGTLGHNPIEICRSPLSCAQQTFKSYVDLYYVVTWSSALQRARKFKDTNLFNPYAELTACKLYDPWFATDKANADLTQRLVLSAITAPLPVPVFFESTSKRPSVIALNSSVTASASGGREIHFNPEFSDETRKQTFFADLGPLVGAPCAIQYSSETGTPFQVYGVSGITVNYCRDDKRSVSDTNSEGASKSSVAKYSICGGCTLNATGILSAATFAAPPGPFRFIVGAMRAFSLYSDAAKDDVNRPITFTVNPAYVADTYNENEKKIPANCTDSLISGYRCHADVCAAHAANEFESRSGIRPQTSSILYEGEEGALNSTTAARSGLVGLRVSECDSEIIARVRCDVSKRKFELLGEFSAFSRSCREIVEKANGRDK